MTPSNSRDKIWTVNCCIFGNRFARHRWRRAVRMLHMHEYPQPQAFSCLRHRFDKPAQPLWRVRNQVTRRAAERDLGKAQECGGPEVCGCSRPHCRVLRKDRMPQRHEPALDARDPAFVRRRLRRFCGICGRRGRGHGRRRFWRRNCWDRR